MLNRRIGPWVLGPAMWFSLNCNHCPVITAKLHSRLAYRPRQRKLQPANLSPVRTLAFEPLGHLPISISEMAN